MNFFNLVRFSYFFLQILVNNHDNNHNHNYNKMVKSDWLSTALICNALIGQFNRTARVMPK